MLFFFFLRNFYHLMRHFFRKLILLQAFVYSSFTSLNIWAEMFTIIATSIVQCSVHMIIIALQLGNSEYFMTTTLREIFFIFFQTLKCWSLCVNFLKMRNKPNLSLSSIKKFHGSYTCTQIIKILGLNFKKRKNNITESSHTQLGTATTTNFTFILI